MQQNQSPLSPLTTWLRTNVPGIAVAAVITLVAIVLGKGEEGLFGYALLEPLVLGLVLGIAIRSFWVPDARFKPGISFAACSMSSTTSIFDRDGFGHSARGFSIT